MELEFKLPKGKLPFIGVRFKDQFTACKLNQDLVNDHKDKLFKITIESIAGIINMRLMGDGISLRNYNGLKYDRAKFKAFMNVPAKLRVFGHIVKTLDADEVVRTPVKREIFVLRIEEIITFNEY